MKHFDNILKQTSIGTTWQNVVKIPIDIKGIHKVIPKLDQCCAHVYILIYVYIYTPCKCIRPIYICVRLYNVGHESVKQIYLDGFIQPCKKKF
jgi:hypothetical protein